MNAIAGKIEFSFSMPNETARIRTIIPKVPTAKAGRGENSPNLFTKRGDAEVYSALKLCFRKAMKSVKIRSRNLAL
jgi:hypothetical protein